MAKNVHYVHSVFLSAHFLGDDPDDPDDPDGVFGRGGGRSRHRWFITKATKAHEGHDGTTREAPQAFQFPERIKALRAATNAGPVVSFVAFLPSCPL